MGHRWASSRSAVRQLEASSSSAVGQLQVSLIDKKSEASFVLDRWLKHMPQPKVCMRCLPGLSGLIGWLSSAILLIGSRFDCALIGKKERSIVCAALMAKTDASALCLHALSAKGLWSYRVVVVCYRFDRLQLFDCLLIDEKERSVVCAASMTKTDAPAICLLALSARAL